MSNLSMISLGMLNYEAAYLSFPGYANRVGMDSQASPVAGSWLVQTFPYEERGDLWRAWMAGNRKVEFLPWAICPSDRSRGMSPAGPPLSYVANCGLPGDEDSPADGVFHNHNLVGGAVTVSLDYLSQHDGASNTLMLSENLQAGYWTDTSEANVGMVWFRTPGPCSRINECSNAGQRPQGLQYARPSSNHGGGAVVSFCDGHQEFLREDIDYQIYQHLMTPDGRAAGLPPADWDFRGL